MEQIFREDLIWLDETFEDKDQFFDKIGKRLYEKGKVKESFADGLKSNPKLAAVGDKVTDKAYFGTGLGIAVRQGNTDLQQKFNAALEKVKKDGTYQTIYNKWFQK